MRSVLLAIAIGLVGAAFIHIVIILALPMWTGKDAWTRVTELGAMNRFYPLANEPNATGLHNDNPHIRSAVCRFDITDGPVRIIASGDVPIWTVAVYDVSSNETYSMNDRSAIGSGVNIAFVELRSRLKDLVYDYGLFATIDAEHFYLSIDEALADIERQAAEERNL